jgi:hypothetical protein
MNFKTTLTLALLVAVGAISWLVYAARKPAAAASETLAVLENELRPEQVSRIEVAHGDNPLVLERGAGAEWTLPGKWPTRRPEVEQLVGLITGLRSRFAPVPLTGDPPDLKAYGLDPSQNPVLVTVRAGDKHYRLLFGAEPGEGNRFSRPTYLRLDDNKEVVRLAPGLVATLERPPDYYQQRRLFPSERVAEGDSQEKTERLAAWEVTAKGTSGAYTLTKAGDDWQLSAPVQDRADPDKLKTLLTAVPDVWAEQFVDKPKDLAAYGLKEPEQTLTVTRPGGEKLTLLVGKQSQMKVRTVMRQPPPFGQPQPPRPEVLHEEYRWAKLKDNAQVFEVKADKLKDVFVAPATLRDTRLARFKTGDVRQVKVTHAGQDIDFVKKDGRWHMQNPVDGDAEGLKVDELLDKLSSLDVPAAELIDKGDPKTYGLATPAAVVKVAVEEGSAPPPPDLPGREGSKKAENQPKKTKSHTFVLGKHGADKKVYVRVEDWQRINPVDESLLKLVERPALAYRGRRVLDFSTADLAKVDVQGKDKFELEQAKEAWRLTTPVKAEADAGKAALLAGDLGRLEAVEYISDAPTKDDLDKRYGLASPAASATVTFAKADKPAQTLLLGKQRGDKPEYFAKLASKPEVFVVKKEIRDALEQNSLAYRPLQLWQVPPDEIAELRLQKEGQEYRLKHEGPAWKIVEPFEATAVPGLVLPMVDDLAGLRCERYEAHAAKDLIPYGLDKPYLRLAFRSEPAKPPEEPKKEKGAEKKEQKPKTEEKKPAPERVLLVGKPAPKDAKARFAKLGDGDAVFVLDEKVVGALDHSALDLLDPQLLTLDAKVITGIRSESGGSNLTLTRDGETWRAEAGATKFPADRDAMAAVLGVWSNLRADKYAAYGPKVDLAGYGLDKPQTTVTISTKAVGDAKAPAKPAHTLTIGKPAGDTGGRYARLDNGPGVVVLAPAASGELTRTSLDFVDRTLVKFDAAKATGVNRRRGAETLEVLKRDDNWQMVKPTEQRADDKTVQDLLEQLANLKAKRVAAYQAKDLVPFGLDDPAVVLTLRLGGAEGKPVQHVLKIGEVADKGAAPATGDRFAVADDGAVVGVLPGALVRRLVAAPAQFRDHDLARFADADQVVLERGPRKVTFAKVDGTWKVTSPLEADAEQTELEDFVNDVARLRADELVGDRPDDKAYGLDRPEARWRFRSGDKDVLNLVVGSLEKVNGKDGPRRYAKLATGELVFLLDPKLSAKVVAEYRSRTPWPSLDSAQVDALSYGYTGGPPFTLEKVNNAWQVAGKQGLQVKQEAVTDALDALARLRAERYVADKGGDLKLYGLEPPRLVLEVRTPTGKRVLHLGRFEGDSKRVYARVPEGNRSDVFVIAAADTDRIVRDLTAFTQGAGKAAKAGR